MSGRNGNGNGSRGDDRDDGHHDDDDGGGGGEPMQLFPEPVVVEGWPKPRGYNNGMVGGPYVLHVAGQIGWQPDGTFTTDDLLEQFAIALDNVLAVVRSAGGKPESIASMTVFVTEIETYRARTKELGPIWKARLGKHFPAMALIGVSALVEPRAKVEIMAVAHL